MTHQVSSLQGQPAADTLGKTGATYAPRKPVPVSDAVSCQQSRGQSMRRAIRGCPRSHVVLAALVIALVVGGCTRGAALKADAAMSTTIAMSPSPGIPSPATAKPVTLVVKGQRRVVSSVSECAALGASNFYREFCQAVLVGDWRAIPVPAGPMGPTPQMLARINRASLDQDFAFCDDPLTIRFDQAGSRVPMDAAAATAACVATLKSFVTNGGAQIFDYTSTDNANPLEVVAP